MAKTAFIDRFKRRLRELQSANGANVTVTFALATIPIVGFVGAAVDYSHAHSIRAAMQAAADSTALMLSKEAATLSTAQIQSKSSEYFKALFTRPEATALVINATFTTSGGSQVKINATSDVKTSFMGIMGFSTIKLAVESQVKWGNTRLRVALVLDTTGSMNSDGKIDALKTATKGLLDQLKAAALKDGDVYVSIIPFSKDVNVGKSNYNATWIDWAEWDNKNGDCSKSSYKTKQQCENNGKTWTTDNHNTWNGCVMDRGDTSGPSSGNYDTNVVPPDMAKPATKFAAEQYSACSPAVMSLNYDWTAMKTLVTGLYPAGMTNQGIGLAHGWMSLVGGGPYPTPPAEDPNYKYSKVIILMSDGLNTQNRWYTSASKIDAREEIACANAKAAGITLYTIHVNTDGDPMSTLLKGCASGPDKFWMLTSANQMVSTFQQIGTALSNLRIAM
jgi:Flp pilus assembly protein TadG